MTPVATAAFLGFAALAAYAQTLTGFAFGLVLIGLVGLFDILPLPDTAVFVSVLVLVNAAQVLRQGWRDVAGRRLGLILIASLPAQFIGYRLLDLLATTRLDLLKLVLGTVIILSAMPLIRQPRPLPRPSGDASHLGFGVLSGLMSGLFSTAGPPLVYHLYRQPLPLATIRLTLVSSFAIAAGLRLAQVVASDDLPPLTQWPCLLAIPVVIAATFAARRWPPPLSEPMLRRAVFTLLLLSGLALAGPAILAVSRSLT